MVSLITGNNGKGKSKVLLEKSNSDVKEILGNVVFLDTSTKHMYELNNKIRLINVSEYLLDNPDKFIGFISGIISQDHDLQEMFFDNFLKLANCKIEDLETIIPEFDKLSEKFGIDFCMAVSTSDGDLPASLSDKVITAL